MLGAGRGARIDAMLAIVGGMEGGAEVGRRLAQRRRSDVLLPPAPQIRTSAARVMMQVPVQNRVSTHQ